MIALIVALLVAILLLALAIAKPILFKMGVGYTKQRPKQTVFIVLGLMITTTVVAGAGIMADSAANSFAQDESSRYEHYDGVVQSFSAPRSDSETPWQDFWAQPRVKDFVAEVESYRTVPAFLLDEDNLGDNLQLYLLSQELQTGLGFDIPENGLVIHPDYAKNGKLSLGDTITLEGSTSEQVFRQGDVFSGVMTAFDGPNGWVVAPGTSNQFAYDLQYASLALTINSSLPDYEVEIISPLGETTTISGNGEQIAQVFADGKDRRGEWQFTIYGQAVNQDYWMEALFDVTLNQAIGGWDGKLTQIGADFETPFYYHQSYAFANLEEFQLDGEPDNFAVKAKPGMSMADFDRRLRSEMEAFDLNGYPQLRSDNPDAEIALVRLAANLTFLSMGGLSIISGIILVVVLMGLLVEERKRALGTMRALGATRGNLTFMHVSEGTVYAGLAGLTGIVGGVILAAALLGAVSQIDAEDVNPVLTANPLVYLSAGAGSALLILAVIAFSAYRISRIDIATAIRGEEQDIRRGRERSKVWAIIWCSLGGLFLLLGFITGNADTTSEEYVPPAPPGITLGVTLASIFFAVGLGPLLSKHVGRTVAMPAVSAVLLLHTILSFQYLKLQSEYDGMGMLVRVMVIPIAFGILVAYSRLIHEGVVRLATRLGGVAALWDSALSSIRGKPGRNAMTIAVLGSVLMGMTAMGALFQTFSFESVGGMGGHDALITMRDGDLDDAYATSGVTIDPFSVVDEAVFVTVATSSIIEGSLYGPIWQLDEYVVGVNSEFIANSNYDFQAKKGDPWQAVMAGEGIILGSGVTLWNGETQAAPKVGSTLMLRSEESLEVVGILAGAGTIVAFVAESHIENGELGVFLQADDTGYAVRVWESAYRALGAQGMEPQLIINEEQQVNDLILTFLSSFMGLGIIIGMISLGLTTTRNVLMRRQEIGVLRAIGARTRDVVTIFAIETAYVTTFSILLGLVGGIAMASAFVNAEGGLNYSLQLDWGLLAILYSFTIIAAALAVTVPAIMASKIRPAEAVRYAE